MPCRLWALTRVVLQVLASSVGVTSGSVMMELVCLFPGTAMEMETVLTALMKWPAVSYAMFHCFCPLPGEHIC